jgi:hypothetical protein
MDSPNSPLSDIPTDEFPDEHSDSASPFPEPGSGRRSSKRPRVSTNRKRATNDHAPPHHSTAAFDTASIHDEGPAGAIPSDADLSSDTEGSVPGSPHLGGMGLADDEEAPGLGGKEQVSVCKWDGCNAGDQGNMDLLVLHLHNEHIHARQKKYSCEWVDCSRKGIPHASGYALRAHMRSHTREKPFYCTLPGE